MEYAFYFSGAVAAMTVVIILMLAVLTILAVSGIIGTQKLKTK